MMRITGRSLPGMVRELKRKLSPSLSSMPR